MACDSDSDTTPPWPPHVHKNYQSPSNSSNASSTSSSAFSIDAPSSQSSVASSTVGWSSSTWHTENEIGIPGLRFQHRRASYSSSEGFTPVNHVSQQKLHFQAVSDSVPPSCRQHPRRTQRLNSTEYQNGQPISQCPRPPPSLIRQSERKDNFVDSLVDTATQMIETIWPLSVLTCGRDAALGAKQQNLIGLRTFVQEVLRRSKTSYSTLQVALYYLILIQSYVPKHDFTMEQTEDTSACRAMQCGRRMFLAALILASKYLQDRNFSARAWSKISGLRTCEINANELAFLSAVNWKLHIPEHIFHKWTDVVLRYSPSAHVNGPPRSLPSPPQSWRSLIPLLTPELDTVDHLNLADSAYDSGYDSPGSVMSPPPIPTHEEVSAYNGSREPTPTNPCVLPKSLEPAPRDINLDAQILPPLPRLGLLPTPQLTPQTNSFYTPAVSASGLCSRRPSMSYAMGEIRRNDLNRMTLDNACEWRPRLPEQFPMSARRSSLATSVSSMSSPDSVVSDRSSRSSRSSSISSVASSNCALPPPRLAMQATRRCATMQLCDLSEDGGATPQPKRPLTPGSTLHRPTSNLSNFRFPSPTSQQTCSGPVVAASTHEAASALRDLALSRQRECNSRSSTASPARSLKRSRTNSIDLSVQSTTRDYLAQRNEEDGKVLPDENIADSFLLQAGNAQLMKNINSDKLPKPFISRENHPPRKRTCAGTNMSGRDETRMYERSVLVGGPGIWAGII